MNTFPILDDHTIQRRRGREFVKSQASSFWIDQPRDGFSAKAAAHFEAMAPPQTAGVTLQLARRNGYLY